MTRAAEAAPWFAIAMASVAWLIGLALYVSGGLYSTVGLALVTLSILVCAASLVWPGPSVSMPTSRTALAGLASLLLVEVLLLSSATPAWRNTVLVLGVFSALQMFESRFRRPLLWVALAAFCAVAAYHVRNVVRVPAIDVFVFQQLAAAGFLHGVNPYAPTYPNVYDLHTPFYGPGVVDASNRLTVGLPYPPLSLMLVLPGYVLGGDCRYTDIFAVAATAWLMATAIGSRWAGLVALLFLATPRVLHVIANSWTESLLVLTFSLVMFSALRWRRALPYALGLFAATKQYSLLSLPLTVMLLKPADGWREWARMAGTAALVVAVVTLPFVLWDPPAFWRSVVEFQFLQPRRADSLSHLVWMRSLLPGTPLLALLPFATLAAAMALVLRRPLRSPACFAGGVTLVHLAFFAFNDQAFANYYYFTVATAAWAAAAVDATPLDVTHA